MKKIMIVSLVLILTCSFLIANEPVSKQATLIETISSAELLVEATGVYVSPEKSARAKQKDVESNGISRATLDAKRSAVWFVILGGTDPILRSAAEQRSFEGQSSRFFSESAISRYISYEDSRFIQRLSIEDGTGMKISKRFKVNKEMLMRDLQEAGIISGRDEISDALGRPQIMVIPSVAKGMNPLEALERDSGIRHSRGVIESHLTAKQYEVLDAGQMDQIGGLTQIQGMIAGQEEDMAYAVALSIGSDVYITYAGAWENAGYNTERHSLTVRAYETSSGRLLGTETGYSQARQGKAMISVEEAVTGAIDAVLARIDAYWRDDIKRGVQYKMVLSIDRSFNEDDAFDIQDIFIDAVEAVSKSYKENIATDYTLDLQAWVNPSDYNSSRALFRAIRQDFNKSSWGANLKTININRKLIQLKVE
ncbi:MAG: hypothetical protein GX106_03295 [Candidatus Cloacimonetes bacterium]|jgi:hypothetical protein|nr:hypothetical protein [Candidatus Cloacimonadota bacterium]